MIQRGSFSLALLAIAACIVAQPRSALAQKSNSPPIQIEIISVTASSSTVGMDPQLAKIPMTRILTSLFGYPSYHMDSKQTERTVCGRMLTFSLPAGHILHIAPLQIDGARLNMQIEMFDGDRPRLGMHALMENRATLILGGPHYQLGMMIVMVNVHIVGSLPPAPPQIHLPHPKIPPAGPSPNANAPVPDAGVPSMPGGISPISTHP